MDLPSNDGFNNYIASYFAKKNSSKIVISGIGGDELFSGYPSFARIPRLNKYLNFIPENNKLNKFLKDYLSIFLRTFKIKSKYAGIFEYGKETSASFLLQRSLFLPDEIKNEFNEINLSEGMKELDIRNKLFNEIKEIKSQKLAIIFLEIKYYMCNKLLRDADWTSMSHSIELRTPLVDLFFFNKLIPLLKTNYNVNKHSMLNCVEKKIPNEIYKRKKTGFNFPQQKLMSDYGYTKKFNEINKNWSIFTYENYLKNNEKKN
jgi:asparagine synthase (glutamine-hydrolysing)